MTQIDVSTAPAGEPYPEIERAYLEYRKACYHTLYRHARHRELLAALRRPATVREVGMEMGFLPERDDVLELLLEALVRFGALLHDESGRYRLNPYFSDDALDLDRDLLAAAAGRDRVEALLHGQSYAGIVDALYASDNRVASDFSGRNRDLWNEFLQLPFYIQARQAAVGLVASPGATVCDLACGPGFGLLELAEKVGEEGAVVGVEVSPDFVSDSIERAAGLPNAYVAYANLEHGVPFLRDDYFDGITMVGALHFIRDRDRLLDDVARILAPGGTFCAAYTLTTTDSYDAELMRLRFSLREPASYPIDPDELVAAAERHGLRHSTKGFRMGCFITFVFDKASEEAPAR